MMLFTLLAVTGNALAAQAQAQTADEYQVKAAFIFNFAKFVEWPQDAFAANASLLVGVVGDDPFGSSIDRMINGNSANGRRLTIKRFRWGDNLRSCQILFISSSERKRMGQIIESLRGASVLTIAETPQFNQQGGIINFVIQQNRVRFEINVAGAAQARLKVSSKLLALSKGGTN